MFCFALLYQFLKLKLSFLLGDLLCYFGLGQLLSLYLPITYLFPSFVGSIYFSYIVFFICISKSIFLINRKSSVIRQNPNEALYFYKHVFLKLRLTFLLGNLLLCQMGLFRSYTNMLCSCQWNQNVNKNCRTE